MKARITWSERHERIGLPTVPETTESAHLVERGARSREAWNLRCVFAAPPAQFGSPTIAEVSFVSPDAPSHWLRVGAQLDLFEPATGEHAFVEVIAP